MKKNRICGKKIDMIGIMYKSMKIDPKEFVENMIKNHFHQLVVVR